MQPGFSPQRQASPPAAELIRAVAMMQMTAYLRHRDVSTGELLSVLRPGLKARLHDLDREVLGNGNAADGQTHTRPVLAGRDAEDLFLLEL